MLLLLLLLLSLLLLLILLPRFNDLLMITYLQSPKIKSQLTLPGDVAVPGIKDLAHPHCRHLFSVTLPSDLCVWKNCRVSKYALLDGIPTLKNIE